jgi:hypothetical protein
LLHSPSKAAHLLDLYGLRKAFGAQLHLEEQHVTFLHGRRSLAFLFGSSYITHFRFGSQHHGFIL